ncbi:MAG: hydantoinase/oxoprolinase family protein [Halodesulfurarchaeum sp.]
MIIGIDTGGTNVDAVILDDRGVHGKAKVPNERTQDSIEAVLKRLGIDRGGVNVDRVVVATTLVVNAAVQNRLPACTNVIVPGPGLAPDRAFSGDENQVSGGTVDHRGRVTEHVDYDDRPEHDVVAITAKFSPRNPTLERRLHEDLAEQSNTVALGNESGAGFSFPERAATTVANAKAKPIFATYERAVEQALASVGIDAPIYFLKGDGAMLDDAAMLSTPAHTVKGGSAASALGLVALTGIRDCIAVDVGGTTTDLTRVRDGFPDTERNVGVGNLETAYPGVAASSLAVGGDTKISVHDEGYGLAEERVGNAVAFGGSAPTLTDALHVLDIFTDGDIDAAYGAIADLGSEEPEAIATEVLEAFTSSVASGIDEMSKPETQTIVVGGVLARALAPRLVDSTNTVSAYAVPRDADVSGAVGCGVARVSVDTAVHIDTERGVKTVTSVGPESVESIETGTRYSDERAREIVEDAAKRAAASAGGDESDPVEILAYDRFNVVDRTRVVGQIINARARVEPAIERVYAGGD